MKHYRLTVQQITKETPDTISIYFRQPAEGKIAYKPGQFLTLLVPVQGETVRRSYSMSSCPYTDEQLCVTVKKVAGGKVSNYLNNQLREGDVLEVAEPMGAFTANLQQIQRHVVLFGAGSGITPLMSIAKAVLRMEKESLVSLIYGNRNEDSIIFKAELAQLQTQYPDRLRILHVLSQPDAGWRGSAGRLNRTSALKLLEELPQLGENRTDYYLCGPSGMMDEVKAALHLLRVPADHVHHESFVTVAAAIEKAVEADDGVIKTRDVTIIYEGTEYKVTVKPEKTILEAGLAAKIDLPYSCQSGLCTACMSKCVSGKIKMDEEDGLSEKERQAGYVLICVGHPLTSDVVIEVD